MPLHRMILFGFGSSLLPLGFVIFPMEAIAATLDPSPQAVATEVAATVIAATPAEPDTAEPDTAEPPAASPDPVAPAEPEVPVDPEGTIDLEAAMPPELPDPASADEVTEDTEDAIAPPAATDPEAPAEPEVPADADAPANPDKPEPVETEVLQGELTDEERYQVLLEGDRLWLQGNYEAAERLYRKAKEPGRPFAVSDRPVAFSDPALLSPAGGVYWREFQAGQEMNLPTRMVVPLQLLTEQYPEFIPAHLQLAEVLMAQERPEEALRSLERATTLYPGEAELVQARIDALVSQEEWLEASIAARQFSVLDPDDPEAETYALLADEYLDEFQDNLRQQLTFNAIANVVTGALGFALTGGLFGPFSAIQTTVLMLRGEEAVGESVAREAQQQLPLVEDPEVVAYVNEIGQRMAAVSGRDEFTYEFFVVRDESLNAFALPGGKIFINAGAIAQTESEAELAGLLAHELAHAVLSHGFQLVIGGNLTANVLQFIPYGGIATDLAVLSYSRDMERQADALATRMLAASGYAADGLQNLMITLGEQQQDYPLEWLSTHPDTGDRINNISLQIDRNGYNRYAFEGVERHREIQQRVQELLDNPDAK